MIRRIALGVLVTGLHATCLYASDAPASRHPSSQMNRETWSGYSYADYGIVFRYPPDAVFTNVGGLLPGFTTVDGRKEKPLEMHFRPVRSEHLLAGVSYQFSIRITMLSDTAKLNPRFAKIYGWTNTPTINLFPFEFPTMRVQMEEAVERLYLGGTMDWSQVEPVTVDGKRGLLLAGWDSRLKDSKFFHEIICVPATEKSVLLVQAVHFEIRSQQQLQNEREIFQNLVGTIRFQK